MKKFILIIISVFICYSSFAQDACSETYIEALQAYNNGNYEDAQRMFVNVAQTCRDYSDVWKKLKDCNHQINKKISQQKKTIETLTGLNSELELQNKHKNEEQTNQLRENAFIIQTKNNALDKASKDIEKLKEDTLLKHDKINALCEKIDMLSKQLKDNQEQIEFLQPEYRRLLMIINEANLLNVTTLKNKLTPKEKEDLNVFKQDTSHVSDSESATQNNIEPFIADSLDVAH